MLLAHPLENNYSCFAAMLAMIINIVSVIGERDCE